MYMLCGRFGLLTAHTDHLEVSPYLLLPLRRKDEVEEALRKAPMQDESAPSTIMLPVKLIVA
jgi:hypothetical protein